MEKNNGKPPAGADAPAHTGSKPSNISSKARDAGATAATTATTAASTNNTGSAALHKPGSRKRRKVNHACVYCRRSHMTCDLERPCTRCVKRNIGHLCHDEPRDPDAAKKAKAGHSVAGHDGTEPLPEIQARDSVDHSDSAMPPPAFDSNNTPQAPKPEFPGGELSQQTTPLQLVTPSAGSALPSGPSASSLQPLPDLSDAWLTTQNQLHEMHNYNPYIGAPEVTNEFNFLSEFLTANILEDSSSLEEQGPIYKNGPQDQSDSNEMSSRPTGSNGGLSAPGATPSGSMPPPNLNQAASIPRPASTKPADKTRDFYLQAADPAGDDKPELRMQRVMKAKYDAGLLRPFNYIKGYARLGQYMDSHISVSSKQNILRQLNRFRPKFREKVKDLTDIELVMVEMWLEKTLMEYDRVFAAMAMPACCWRRTGEIVRGNKEMAELIHVPVERLRDGQISLHEILTEDSLVRYWEEFGTIAFDPAHDTLLTACALKSPDDKSRQPKVNCCFSLMIRRDEHKIPNLIVGNFLPHDPGH